MARLTVEEQDRDVRIAKLDKWLTRVMRAHLRRFDVEHWADIQDDKGKAATRAIFEKYTEKAREIYGRYGPFAELTPEEKARRSRTRVRDRESDPTDSPRADRPTSGQCEHCGGLTKGGRFLPGHDAKLKGDLIREGTLEAMAERVARGWIDLHHPSVSLEAKEMAEEGAFLQRRIAARTQDQEDR